MRSKLVLCALISMCMVGLLLQVFPGMRKCFSSILSLPPLPSLITVLLEGGLLPVDFH